MSATPLNEHDANQGAQSTGEFLGMTGNSGWYLLGSGGATILMVILLWGVLGISLLLCLLIGVVLCGVSVAYVFALRNNKPEHYDTDFFESALVEAGLMAFHFGPHLYRPPNPFLAASASAGERPPSRRERAVSPAQAPRAVLERRPAMPASVSVKAVVGEHAGKKASVKSEPREEPMVPRAAYEQLQEELNSTEALLEDALHEGAED